MKTRDRVRCPSAVMALCLLCSGQAWAATEGDPNNFFGTGAGGGNPSGIVGVRDSFFGAYAGNSITTGSSNTFVGFDAGFSNNTGSSNTFIGDDAGFFNNGSGNTFVGAFAGAGNTTGRTRHHVHR